MRHRTTNDARPKTHDKQQTTLKKTRSGADGGLHTRHCSVAQKPISPRKPSLSGERADDAPPQRLLLTFARPSPLWRSSRKPWAPVPGWRFRWEGEMTRRRDSSNRKQERRKKKERVKPICLQVEPAPPFSRRSPADDRDLMGLAPNPCWPKSSTGALLVHDG